MFKRSPRSGVNNLATATEIDHQRLIALINSMSDGVIALRPDFKVSLTNSAALDILNVNSLKNQFLPEVVEILDKSGKKLDIAGRIKKNRGSLSTKDWRLRFSDGSLANIFISISPVRLSYGSRQEGGYVIILRDITREKLVEDERDEFVSVAGHELRTPVTIAEGSLSNALLLAEQGQLKEPIMQSLKTAHEQILFLSNMINDLAMLSRAERGKLALSVESFKINALMESLVKDYEPKAHQKNLDFSCTKLAKDRSLSSSYLYVREILQNLITNALKYTEKGSIKISVEAQPDGVAFRVEDSGIGIGENEQGKLFTKFFRSDDWRVKRVHGTGLGLYITGKLVNLLNGRIQFKSQLNKGSAFSLKIPNLSSGASSTSKSD